MVDCVCPDIDQWSSARSVLCSVVPSGCPSRSRRVVGSQLVSEVCTCLLVVLVVCTCLLVVVVVECSPAGVGSPCVSSGNW